MALNQVTLQLELMEFDLLIAASKGNKAWLQYILENENNVDRADTQGFTAIHFAAFHGRLECLKLLHEKYNVDVNLPSKAGWRPIHLALNRKSRTQALNCVRYLIEKGANINVCAEGKVTPLHQASREGLHECITALVEAGADVHAKNAQGHKPIDICKLWCHRNCARYLSTCMWKKDKATVAQEIQRLTKLKSNLQEAEEEMYDTCKEYYDHQRQVAFNNWIESKQLPERLKVLPTYQKMHPSGLRVATGKLMDKILALKKKHKNNKRNSQFYEKESETIIGLEKEEKPDTMPQLNSHEKHTSTGTHKSLQSESCKTKPSSTWQNIWNYSTNIRTHPVSNIFRPVEIRLSTSPDETKDHDLGSYVFLSKDKQGKPKITAAAGQAISPVPKLSYEIIKRNLFPESVVHRIHIPQEFKATYVFDLEKKRSPTPAQRPMQEMVFHLRETLDPKYMKLIDGENESPVNESNG
ncbi:ankyrin repeat domain-containing protein 53 [Rhinatrema bivittatum]|uniref:ankyrin repeat domain-containing protein 53 n=1 Tax=Rhinatrema bivittatum TaxID=194408 RepID=UPI00112EDCF8|nr:ankyrin repeat domain-containing protein 53 [Rhinatrema bivittatum]XP_029450139.1 ankyrin repeat domain-containing protein 53 [Rhinatrema bivittatum]